MSKARRHRIVPEVVQTSAMDCGPAALKALLEGFGLPVSYGRLREACQTDVDGTSIDTLEDVARLLGLDAEQVIVPIDHLLIGEAEALPALVVVRLPSGFTHFVVAWRSHPAVVQLMDPATGRRWPTHEQFVRDVYVHTTTLSAETWREFAASPRFLGPLGVRMRRIGAGGVAGELVDGALADTTWRALAALDASVRFVDAIVRSGGLRRGRDASSLLRELTSGLRDGRVDDTDLVPEVYWFARPAGMGDGGEEQLRIRGAIIVHVDGREGAPLESVRGVSPELVAALSEPPSRPVRDLLRTLGEDGALAPGAVTIAAALAAVGTAIEAILFRSLFDIGRHLGVTDKRLWATSALMLFLGGLLFLELPLASSIARMGRRLDGRFRMAFLRKIPRLGDRYFQSRPVSDMAERNHGVHALRALPGLGGQLLRTFFSLAFTALGVAWIDPGSAPLAAGIALLSVGLPWLLQRTLAERDLRVRSHGGALGRHYLDALLGLVPARAHGAEPALRREHESLLVEWVHASRARDRIAIGADALQSLLAFGLTGWLFLSYFGRAGEPGGALLLLYWAISLPGQGQALAQLLGQVPAHRNVALRLVEPLGAIEEAPERDAAAASPRRTAPAPAQGHGVDVRFEGVGVLAGGHAILEDVDLEVPRGAHVAIVGPSGAGKSSLVGLLLGWHRAAAGRVLVDGAPLDGARLDELRAWTAWVDPAIHIWNRSMIDNLVYGGPDGAERRIGDVVEQADLARLLESLPDGLATWLGEGGGLVSGGEGQRVRLGRGALHSDARLVVLDEPFRGLDRERRRELLRRAREWWRGATLFCITHDVGETRDFERVIVVDGGRVIEDGAPEALARSGSRYAAMLAAEDEVRTRMWAGATWRHVRLEGGVLHEASPATASDGAIEEAAS